MGWIPSFSLWDILKGSAQEMSTWESRSISALPLQCRLLVELQVPSTQPWPAARRNRQVVLVHLLAGTVGSSPREV